MCRSHRRQSSWKFLRLRIWQPRILVNDNSKRMRLLVPKRNQYGYAFRLLAADFLRVCEFVEPIDANLYVYSHRLYELLLRVCTEFESICKEVLVSERYAKP